MNALGRVLSAWRALAGAQRQVALACGLLLLSMFLPWYSRDYHAIAGKTLASAHDNSSAIGVFSFVEAAIFLVAIAVLIMMFARGENRAFHLPGGDGLIVTIAGGWCAFLVFYRFVDQPSGKAANNIAFDYNVHWGIFFGLLAAGFLAYAGNQLRRAELGEPAIPGRVSPTTPAPAVAERTPDVAPRRRRRAAPPGKPVIDGGEQLSFEEAAAASSDAPYEDDEDEDAYDDEPTAVADEHDLPTRRVDPFERPATFDDDPPEFPPRRRPRS